MELNIVVALDYDALGTQVVDLVAQFTWQVPEAKDVVSVFNAEHRIDIHGVMADYPRGRRRDSYESALLLTVGRR